MADRTGYMDIRGVNCQYDTLLYRHVGPGVTYTQFQFNSMRLEGNIPYKMRMHLLTIDMTNPYNRLSPYLTDDKYYSTGTQGQEVSRQKAQGLKPIASVNATAFVQSPPSSTNEPYTYMETYHSLVSDGLIRYEDDGANMRYYSDASKTGYVETLRMKATITSSKGISAEIGQINHHRDHARKNNKLALFCNGMDQAGEGKNKAKDSNPNDGMEVFLQGDDIRVGSNQLTVVKRLNGCGARIESGQCVITGVGSALEGFLSGLEPGEQVTIDVSYNDANGSDVSLTDSYTAFRPNCVRNGVPAGWGEKNYAISATGVSADGNTVYLADLEISQYSNAPTGCIEDFLIAVGAWNACYHDGGPSAEMTVDGRFVTNNSVGMGFDGRYIPNGVMVYSTAPDDNNVVSVECDDTSLKRMSIGSILSLKAYGYNQYGEMIDTKAIKNSAVEISCPQGLGEMVLGEFIATKAGVGEILIGVKGQGTQVRIPIVVEGKKELILSPSAIFTGEDRPVQLSVKYVDGDEVTEIDPRLVTWEVDEQYVVSSCENGLIEPYMDGYATVTATYNGIFSTAFVEVENLETEGLENYELTNLLSPSGNLNIHLPSVPHSIYLETKPIEGETVTLTYKTGDKEKEAILENKSDVSVNVNVIDLDYDAVDTYPVVVKSIKPSTTEIKRLFAVYTGLPTGINDLLVEQTTHFEFSRSGENLTLTNCSEATNVIVTVYGFDGILLAEKQTYLSEAESCTLDVKQKDPIIVRIQTKYGVKMYKLMSE